MAVLVLVGTFWGKLSSGSTEISWRQTIKLTIDTPKGRVSGQGTQAKTLTFGKQLLTDMGSRADMLGEAVYVDLQDGRALFVLFEETTSLLATVSRVFHGRRRASTASAEDQARRLVENTELMVIREDLVPTMVVFDDVRDPLSGKFVTPASFTEVLGPGFAYVEATLQVTEAPVTWGRVDAVLGWFADYPEQVRVKHTDPTKTQRTQTIDPYRFIRPKGVGLFKILSKHKRPSSPYQYKKP